MEPHHAQESLNRGVPGDSRRIVARDLLRSPGGNALDRPRFRHARLRDARERAHVPRPCRGITCPRRLARAGAYEVANELACAEGFTRRFGRRRSSSATRRSLVHSGGVVHSAYCRSPPRRRDRAPGDRIDPGRLLSPSVQTGLARGVERHDVGFFTVTTTDPLAVRPSASVARIETR